MSWIISILIVIYLSISFASLVTCSENELLDFHWNEYNVLEKIMHVVLIINITVICIGLVASIVWFVHACLMEIPQFKEFIIRMEWK